MNLNGLGMSGIYNLMGENENSLTGEIEGNAYQPTVRSAYLQLRVATWGKSRCKLSADSSADYADYGSGSRGRSLQSGVSSHESGLGSQESGVGARESGVRSRESGVGS
ncbi:MAG TPA: hypothetical protein VJ180_09410, partial [Pyrinomonadaceae bacterium]|nr:hypothetical protein [Pyrinomonadaceae bacterium]